MTVVDSGDAVGVRVAIVLMRATWWKDGKALIV